MNNTNMTHMVVSLMKDVIELKKKIHALEEETANQKKEVQNLKKEICVLKQKKEEKVNNNENSKTSVEMLNLSPRIFNALKRAQIEYVEDLKGMSEQELIMIRDLGKKACEEIHEKLKEFDKKNSQ